MSTGVAQGHSEAGGEDTLSAVRALQASEEYEKLREAVDRRLREPNIFHVISALTRVEGAHSDLLAWLATPEQWHGLGDEFARQLLGFCITKVRGHRPVPWPPRSKLEIVSIVREFSTSAGPIDLLIQARVDGSPVVLGIENKIDSPEAPGQLDRYAEGLAYKFRDTVVIVTLLAPDDMAPTRRPRIPWSSLSYAEILASLERALASGAANSQGDHGKEVGTAIVRQYMSIVRSDIMKTDEELGRLCSELYRKHPVAWREIRARLPSEEDDLHTSLAKAACGVLSQHHPGEWRFAIRRGRYALVYRSEWIDTFGLSGKAKHEFVTGVEGELSSPAVAIVISARAREDEETGGAPAQVRVEVRLRIWDGPKTGDSTQKLLKTLKAKRRLFTQRIATRLAKSPTSAAAITVEMLSGKKVQNTLKLVRG